MARKKKGIYVKDDMQSPVDVEEYVKMIVWPRGDLDSPKGKLHRYVLIGMVVTKTPLDVDKNQSLLEGETSRMGGSSMLRAIVEATYKGKVSTPLGDSNYVLLSLGDIKSDDQHRAEDPCWGRSPSDEDDQEDE